MAIKKDLYSKENIEKMKALKKQTQGQGEVDPNLVDMAMTENMVINKQPTGTDNPAAPVEFDVENKMATEAATKVQADADAFMQLPMEEQVRFLNTLPAETRYAVELKTNALQNQVAERTPVGPNQTNVPFREGLSPTLPELPGNVPYQAGMAPQMPNGKVSFKPLPSPQNETLGKQPVNTPIVDTTKTTNTSPSSRSPAMTDGEKGIKDYYDALNKEQEIKNTVGEESQTQLQNQIKRFTELNAEKEANVFKAQQEADKQLNDYLNYSVDQNRIFKNQSANQKTMTSIGVFLGALSNALTGQKDVSKNPALMAIDKAIENDIRSQELEMAKLKEGVNLSNNRVARFMDMFKDKDMALRETFALENLGIAKKLEQQMGKNESLKNNALMLQAIDKYRTAGENARLQNRLIMSQIGENEMKAKLAESQATATKIPLSEGEKAVDQNYAQFYNNFSGSGAALAKTTIDQLKGWRDMLKEESKNTFEAGGGRLTGITPDILRTRQSLLFRDQIPAKANLVLKELFGGQLSDKERESEAKAYYSDNQDSATNAQILTDKINQLENKFKAELMKAKYFEQNRTLKGFETQLPKNMKKGL